MARNHTKPRYFKSRHAYYVTINGRQYCLAKGPEHDTATKRVAWEKFKELLSQPLSTTFITCQELFDLYNQKVTPTKSEKTQYINKRFHPKFLAKFGTQKVHVLKQSEVYNWLTSFTHWSPNTFIIVARTLIKPFNWGLSKNNNLIQENPLKGITRGYTETSRAHDTSKLITENDHNQLLLAASLRTSHVLIALNETGARPGEILNAKVSDYDPLLHALVPEKYKLKHKQKRRIIYLTKKLETLILELIQTKNPFDYIFLNNKHTPFTEEALARWMQRTREKLGLGKMTPYMYRHKFATEFLLQGGRLAILASLLGSSIKVLMKHYAHIGEHSKELLEEVIWFRQGSCS